MEIGWLHGWWYVLCVLSASLPIRAAYEPVVPTALRFTKRAYNATIQENAAVKTYVRVDERMGIRCPDPEFDIQYKITGGNRDHGFFKAQERQVGDFWFLLIRIRTGPVDVLNRERRDHYTLTVRANITKNSRKVAETETTVFINVLDVNDLSPLFLASEYNASVSEDTALYASLLKVEAADPDVGANGEVYYYFQEATEQFAVHPTTGVISLTRPLRYAEKSLHEMTVLAKDRGVSSKRVGKPSSAKVKITVTQVNLHAPEIHVQHLPDIIEQSNADIYAIVRVTDADTGVHGEIEGLDVVEGDPEGHFRVRPSIVDGRPKKNEYNIEVLRLLDREKAPHGYNLTLRARDKGVPPRETFKSIMVQLTDLNDNAPVFDREEYEVNIPETAPVNSPVIKVKVTDADLGKNAQVVLEIVGGNERREFRINSDTGMLYTAVPLDAEVKSYYTLTVSALDQGNVGSRKQTAAKIKVNVIDANDNDPTFDEPETNVTINENEPVGTVVTRVQARDRDSGENSYISFFIDNLNPVPFEMDHFTGVIRTTQVLDYESMRREYVLKIRAADWGLPYRRQSEMQLKVQVKDVNDNRPQFEKVDCVGHVLRTIPVGREIMTLSAIDFDAGNIVTYRIISGNEDSCFSLDPNVGTLSVTCDLTDLKVNVRELNVTATDSSHFSDTCRIRVNLVTSTRSNEPSNFECRDTGVTRKLTEILAASEKNNLPVAVKQEFPMVPSRYGENLHAPELMSFPTEIYVNESVPLGYELATIVARDRDRGYNGELIYGISSGDVDSVFRIDPEKGKLKLTGFLDRERRDKYELNITVYDLGRPQKSVSRLLPIVVVDVNDNAPKFEKNLIALSVPENQANGSCLYKLSARDADTGENARITYSIVYETREFRVNASSGQLCVVAPLDRERQSAYELTVRAVDGPNDLASLHSDALVRIAVTDVNDNPPTFALSTYKVHAREDLPLGTVIAILTATDPDLENGGRVKYSMHGEPDSERLFAIDKLTGTVRLAQALDFEERQVHTLTVRALDGGTPSLSSETTLVVDVVDVNENMYAPVFEDFVVECSVAENQPPGTLVTRVKATDADAVGDDSRVAYSIREGDGLGYFSVDAEGNVKTLVALDAETKTSYWITIFAQDHAVVPLHSILHVYIQVNNVNDNVPLTLEPVYYPYVNETTPAHTPVISLTAVDKDMESNETITFRISGGNQFNLFSIDPVSGLIETTGRKLDRETQGAEHALEIVISDNGFPSPLTSTTKVIVTVNDTNDNAPQFDKNMYVFKIPQTKHKELPLQQAENEQNVDASPESVQWESFSPSDISGEALFRVVATDKDVGENAVLHYTIDSGRNKGVFSIHPALGIVYSERSFSANEEYSLQIRATDGGTPNRDAVVRVNVVVLPTPEESPHPPIIQQPEQRVQMTETDAQKVEFLVALIQASDEDRDHLWYYIHDGDPRSEFMMDDNGAVLLARPLNWTVCNKYNLTIRVTDGVHDVFAQLLVDVHVVSSSNKFRPQFTRKTFAANVSESAPVGSRILQLEATHNNHHQNLYYSFHNAQSNVSLEVFTVDYQDGTISVLKSLDRESIAQHVLTVMVKDDGTPGKRNYARVVIDVFDANDHAPEFSMSIMQGRVFETAAVGTTVLQVLAMDKDHGDNAAITYHIASGNLGNTFKIDETLGTLQVAKELDANSMHYEYLLSIKAVDKGKPPLSSTLTVHIMVVMADNAPPRFSRDADSSELFENEPPGTVVKYLEVRSTSSLMFEITAGDENDMFEVNPSTGVVVTKRSLDYETAKMYNLSVMATNMAGAKAVCSLVVHVLDRNDNVPQFLELDYRGFISEAAPVGSLVLASDTSPLALKARDNDFELNALLQYEIVEAAAKRMFYVVSNTGVIRTVVTLDYEQLSEMEFHVRVSDLGKPKLTSETVARVRITLTDVNDCPPQFLQTEYNATVIVPTYQNVAVIQLNATDRDSKNLTKLAFAIVEGNSEDTYAIAPDSGLITVQDPINGLHTSPHKMKVTVTDGLYTTESTVNVKWERSEDSGLVFQRSVYHGVVQENTTKVVTVAVVNVIGSALDEHLVFSILNPTPYFTIGQTSGAIRTTGRPFDRETQEYHQLIVQAKSDDGDASRSRIAHVPVNVTVLDENDNSPMFVNLPYYAVASVDAEKGAVITKVHAVDLDKGENGEVRYELTRGHGELFRVDRKSGEIILRQKLDRHNKEYHLVIAAFDGGMNSPRSTEVTVNVKVIDKSMPVFDKQFYAVSVPENIDVNSHLSVSMKAESSLSRKLIYSISNGNAMEQFAIDFNTAYDSGNGPCTIYVVDNLDYEQVKDYALTIRATDGVSGVYAEILLNVLVTDVNDCPPEFTEWSYNISVSEAAPYGSFILKVAATDQDTGANSIIRYAIQKDAYNSTENFQIDAEEGNIYLRRHLDHETRPHHHFIVIATDSGQPALSSTAHVWLSVIDVNDNAPKFEQTSYTGSLVEDADRGQFATVITATDPDVVDQDHLTYNIVGGNQLQNFALNSTTGVIALNNLQRLTDSPVHLLNVSVSDGVFTSFARIRIEIQSTNLHAPQFKEAQYEARIPENHAAGLPVLQVLAIDKDTGVYGQVNYSIVSALMSEKFHINNITGEITTKQMLDREERKLYEVLVLASDAGGRSSLATVRITVTDVNDNVPRFQLDAYKACIRSTMTSNSVFLKVKAVDKDEGLAAQIEYSIHETANNGITELFAVNKVSGGISLLKTLESFENQMFQFFVRATDHGTPAMYADVPVDVYIMSAKDQPPVFEKNDDKSQTVENSPAGTVVAHVKLVTSTAAKFRLLSHTNVFAVDADGQVTALAPLDRERNATYVIGVLAYTDSTPPLTALSEVHLQVIDANDNAPQFENEVYRVSIAENMKEGTSLVRVHANDKDDGKNAEVRYSLDRNETDFFSIDPFSGWVTNLVSLDRERQASYTLDVITLDGGNPPLNATTKVYVNLVDVNDNPSMFAQSSFVAAVKENTLAGTVVMKLTLQDDDGEVPANIAFYITSGNPLGQFSVRNTGEVYVQKAVDRELTDVYHLNITATDGKFVTATTLTINILDVNDEQPYCLKYRYYQALSEAAVPGTDVLTIEASDADLEPKLRFYLTGLGAESFSLEGETGKLKVARPLDRETRSRYELTAHVQDRERTDWECLSQVIITVSDVNDNAPVFVAPSGNATVLENAEVGTLVTKVHASDADVGVNRRIRYYMVDSAQEHFKIAAESGIVTLAKPLDRETREVYNVSIKAVDQGSPMLSTVTSLLILVLDVNDNPPEFRVRTNYASIPESTLIGTEVVRVYATNLDTGINAEILYSIVGGNEYERFTIDPVTGVISLAQYLDYEKVKDYVLTVQATDQGTPPLSNQATVNVTVIDANDNMPIFAQKSYSTRVSEDIAVEDIVIQVTASDVDSGANGKVTYSMERGDRHQQFAVDPNTGHITVVRPLDREMVSSYTLQVRATDGGTPELTSVALVSVEVVDVNDNPPLFSLSNYSCVVQEDKQPGWTICRLNVTDADTAANGPPFSFDIISGSVSSFKVDADGSVKLTSKLKFRVQEMYSIIIRVYDNGLPPLFSDCNLTIKVIEESQYKPTIVPLDIWVGSYRDRWNGGGLGRVRASDQDPYDLLVYSIVDPHHGLFNIEERTGVLTAVTGLDTGSYRLNVSVTDGKFTAYEKVMIKVDSLDDDMLNEGVSIRLKGVSAQNFILTHKKKLLESLITILQKDVRVVSIQEAPQGHLDLLFIVRGGLELTDMHQVLQATGLATVSFPCNCVKQQGVCRQRLSFLHDQMQLISTDLVSFVAPAHAQQLYCACTVGYSGTRCENRISTNCSCPAGLHCVFDNNVALTYRCVPPPVVATSCDKNATCPPFGTSSLYTISLEQMIAIVTSLVFILFVICLIILCRRCRRTHSPVPQEDKSVSVLNSEYKRNSKITNLEATQSLRPASYSAATSNYDLYVTATQLNNLDTLRSYGSAGDELENVPPDYLRNLNRAPNIPKQKITNDLKRLADSKKNKISRQTLSCVEEAKLLGGYHWDCSDWIQRSQNPLPNITEVPGSEVPDSSSQSDESNESSHLNIPVHSRHNMESMEAGAFLSYRSDDDDDDDDDGVIPYGFPRASKFPSQSDLSTNVCDIDDSDHPL